MNRMNSRNFNGSWSWWLTRNKKRFLMLRNFTTPNLINYHTWREITLFGFHFHRQRNNQQKSLSNISHQLRKYCTNWKFREIHMCIRVSPMRVPIIPIIVISFTCLFWLSYIVYFPFHIMYAMTGDANRFRDERKTLDRNDTKTINGKHARLEREILKCFTLYVTQKYFSNPESNVRAILVRRLSFHPIQHIT